MSANITKLLSQPFGDDADPAGFWLLLREHLLHLQARNYAADTLRLRYVHVKAFALWCGERDLTQPRQVTRPILESYQRHLSRQLRADGQPLSWRSQEMHLIGLQQLFRFLVRSHHLAINPAAELELPRQPKRLPQAILSADEVERILAMPDTATPLGLRDRAILETFYSCGIRRAELCRLRLDQLDVERKAVFISKGKGQKDRYVPIGLRALLWIARYVEHARERLLLGGSEPTLFVTAEGKPLSPDSLTEYTRRYIRAAGITKPGSCHLFRHTMATLMLEGGADVRYIQAILGHERLETTAIYTRTALAKLLEVHRRTHPAERPDGDSDSGNDDASPPTDPQR